MDIGGFSSLKSNGGGNRVFDAGGRVQIERREREERRETGGPRRERERERER